MNIPAYISIALGVLFIVSRSPLIIWPEATRDFYLKMMASNTRIRITGIFVLMLSVIIVLSLRGVPGSASLFFTGFGYFMALVAVFSLLAFPGIFKLVFEAILKAMDNVMLRGVGVLAVGLGVFFIWVGISLLA
jgi:uncharacterized protein YjeT (DUF2065 family)